MTDNDIIKALECWTKPGCKGCPFLEQGCFDCGYIPTDVSNEILDLINRQREELEELKEDYIPKLEWGLKRANEIGMSQDAEIERLKEFIEKDQGLILKLTNVPKDEYDNKIKSEAIKEFAERLKEQRYGELHNRISFSVEYLDNLVKEMTEVSE